LHDRNGIRPVKSCAKGPLPELVKEEDQMGIGLPGLSEKQALKRGTGQFSMIITSQLTSLCRLLEGKFSQARNLSQHPNPG